MTNKHTPLPHAFTPEDNDLDYIYGPLPVNYSPDMNQIGAMQTGYTPRPKVERYNDQTREFPDPHDQSYYDQLLDEKIEKTERVLINLRTYRVLSRIEREKSTPIWHRIIRALSGEDI